MLQARTVFTMYRNPPTAYFAGNLPKRRQRSCCAGATAGDCFEMFACGYRVDSPRINHSHQLSEAVIALLADRSTEGDGDVHAFSSRSRHHLAQSEMFDLAQGAGDDPRRGSDAGRHRLCEDAAERRGHQGRAQSHGDEAARAAAPQGHALRGTGPRRRRAHRRRAGRGDARASDPDRTAGGADIEGRPPVPTARAA